MKIKGGIKTYFGECNLSCFFNIVSNINTKIFTSLEQFEKRKKLKSPLTIWNRKNTPFNHTHVKKWLKTILYLIDILLSYNIIEWVRKRKHMWREWRREKGDHNELKLVRNMLYKRTNEREGRVCIFLVKWRVCNIPWKKGRQRVMVHFNCSWVSYYLFVPYLIVLSSYFTLNCNRKQHFVVLRKVVLIVLYLSVWYQYIRTHSDVLSNCYPSIKSGKT